MPVCGSLASLSRFGFFAPGAATTPTDTYWYFNAVNLKQGLPTSTSVQYSKLTYTNNSVYQSGTKNSNTATYRPYFVRYSNTGGLAAYRTFNENSYNGIETLVDSLGNQHVLLHYASFGFLLRKYNSGGTLVYSKRFDYSGSPGTYYTSGMVIDSSDNLYISGVYTNNNSIVFTKIDCSTYTVQWSNQLLGAVGVNLQGRGYQKMIIDYSGDIYYATKYGSSTISYHLYKIDSSGNFLWSYKNDDNGTNGNIAITVDGGNNVYMMARNRIIKFDYNGNILFEYTVSLPTGGTLTDTHYTDMALNSNSNLVFIIGGASGVPSGRNSLYLTSISSTANSGDSAVSTSRIALASFLVGPVDVMCTPTNTYVLCDTNNNVVPSAVTSSVFKLSPDGYPPNVNTSVAFSQTWDNSTTYNWSSTLNYSTLTNVTVTNIANSGSSVPLSASAITVTPSNVSLTAGTTTVTIYAKHLT